jgi:hypothetical protein
MGKMGFSFSWKRATGVTAAKRKASKALGVPLTKAGRQQKVGKAAGCGLLIAMLCAATAVAAMIR